MRHALRGIAGRPLPITTVLGRLDKGSVPPQRPAPYTSHDFKQPAELRSAELAAGHWLSLRKKVVLLARLWRKAVCARARGRLGKTSCAFARAREVFLRRPFGATAQKWA